jgi:hypothetical protein
MDAARAFAAAVRTSRRVLTDRATAVLQSGMTPGAAKLRKMAIDENLPASIQLTAPRTVLEFGYRAMTKTFEPRLMRLRRCWPMRRSRRKDYVRMSIKTELARLKAKASALREARENVCTCQRLIVIEGVPTPATVARRA